MSILLIEDDQWLGECYVDWLAKAGFAPHWVRSAQEALDVLAGTSFSAIVLDLFLPQANGVQLLGMLASYEPMPIIVCSGALPPKSVDWRAYGVVATLDKTNLTRPQFVAAIKAVV